jgi:hypothetical protein
VNTGAERHKSVISKSLPRPGSVRVRINAFSQGRDGLLLFKFLPQMLIWHKQY